MASLAEPAQQVEAAAGAVMIDQAMCSSHGVEGLPARSAEWDDSLFELTCAVQSQVPPFVEQCWSGARHRASCGLIAEVHHAWVSVDSAVYLWDYREREPRVQSVPADATVMCVAACAPRRGIFDTSVQLLLVVATRLTVSLAGLAGPGAGGRPAVGALVPLDGYSAPADGALFRRIRHTPDGHIFLLCGAPRVFELAYSHEPGWLCAKCRLVSHVAGWWSWARGLLAGPLPVTQGHVRLLECTQLGFVFTVDHLGTLRLLRAHDASSSRPESLAVLEELAALRCAAIAAQVAALGEAPLGSCVLARLHPAVAPDGCPVLRAATAAGERLLFACGGAGGAAAAPCGGGPRARASAAAARGRYGLVLREVSRAPGGESAAAARPSPWARRELLDDAGDPGLCSGGVWLQASQGAAGGGAELRVAVCHEGAFGADAGGGPVEMRKTLALDGAVLDLVEEHSALACAQAPATGAEALAGDRSFAALLPGCVLGLRLRPRAGPPDARRPPSSAAECCAYLAQLSRPAGAVRGWRLSLDDVGVPSFEEQQRSLQLRRPPPPPREGRWLLGLLRFLAAALRPVWGAPLVAAAGAAPHGLRVGLSQDAVARALSLLAPALDFVRRGVRGLGEQPSAAAAEGAAGRWAALCAARGGARATAEARALRSLLAVLEAAERAREVLALAQLLLQRPAASSAALAALAAAGGGGLPGRPVAALASLPVALAPAAVLCGLLLEGCSRAAAAGAGGAGSVDELCRELRQVCPAIYEQVQLRPGQGEPADPAAVAAEPGHDGAELARADLLLRYAQHLPVASGEDAWALRARAVGALAREDACQAVDTCLDALRDLAESDPAAHLGRANLLLKALLEAVAAAPEAQARGCAERLLGGLRSLPLAAGRAAPHEDGLPPLQAAALELLLRGPAPRAPLSAMLTAGARDVEAFLRRRCSQGSRAAGDHLCAHYLARGEPGRAGGAMLQLAESPGLEGGLPERLECLRLAREHVAAMPHPQEEQVARELGARCSAAHHVQLPLSEELRLLAGDARVPDGWRSAAAKAHRELQDLRGLPELYEAAVNFGLYGLALAAAALGASQPEPGVVSGLWACLVCLPADAPFFDLQDARLPAALFPALFCSSAAGRGLAAAEGERPAAGLLQRGACAVLQELQLVADRSSWIWDLRSIACALELASCAWLRALDEEAPAGPCAARPSSSVAPGDPDEGVAWVALVVMRAEPFRLGLPEIVAFYAEMLSQLGSWLPELLSALTPGARRPRVTEEDMHLHLAAVALAAVGRWLALAQEASAEAHSAAAALRAAWPRSVEGLLAGVALRLDGVRGAARGGAAARRLLPEALRLDAACRQFCR